MSDEKYINIMCPFQDWGIFFAIGAARKFISQGKKVKIITKSIAQENVMAASSIIDICDVSSISGKIMFMAPDPIAERDARERKLQVFGCVADETDERWLAVSSCWNGQNDLSITELYKEIFGEDMDMRIFEHVKGTKPYAGVAIRNEPVRMLIKSAFLVDNSRLWHVPIRQNVSKRIQESCVCASLVTDDPFCALASYAHGNSVILLRNVCDGIPRIHSGSRLTEQDVMERCN